jgi:hypothetical protein
METEPFEMVPEPAAKGIVTVPPSYSAGIPVMANVPSSFNPPKLAQPENVKTPARAIPNIPVKNIFFFIIPLLSSRA